MSFKRSAIYLSLVGIIVCSPANASQSLVDAANKTIICSEVREPDARLACFDAASKRLASILNPTSLEEKHELPAAIAKMDEQPIYKPQAAPKTVQTPKAPEPSLKAQASTEPQLRSQKETEEVASAATDNMPTWAAPPQHSDEERAQDVAGFQATIVRITRNGLGRHKFYTDDGAVWEQTQIVNVVPPKSLPTVAEFRRKLTGNPTIQFGVSSRSYRVRRIE